MAEFDYPGAGYGSEELRVPKTRVPVEVVVEGGGLLSGCVHVLPDAGLHEGRERVIDLLQSVETFLPVTGGQSLLVNKERIVLVRIADALDAGWEEADAADPRIAVRLVLAGMGQISPVVEGQVLIAMPPGRGRVLDYLNLSVPFLPLRTESGVVIVARRYIIEVAQPA